MDPISLRSGVDVTLPVEATHPLAPAQSFRMPSADDIANHPVYSKVLQERVASELARFPAEEQTAARRASVQSSVIARLQSALGHIVIVDLEDIDVAAGQTVTYKGNWHQVNARNVRIAPGGVIRVVGTDRSLSATLELTCDSLSSE